MFDAEYPSPLLERAVTALSQLPGIGRKTALRLSMHLLRNDPAVANEIGDSLIALRRDIRYCRQCHNISDTDLCPICADTNRDHTTVCVVESIREVMSFENTRQFDGVYHVLGGLISPLDGVGPDKLEIESLTRRVAAGDVREVILALSATLEGDTTNFYIARKLASCADVKISQIARGVSVGNEIEFTDEVTLGRSLTCRTPFGGETPARRR